MIRRTGGGSRVLAALGLCLVVLSGAGLAAAGPYAADNVDEQLSSPDRGAPLDSASAGQADAGTGAVQADATASFSAGIVAESRGDVATITINLDGTDTATLTIGSTDVNYVLQTTVRDGNGDGTVRVRFNSYTAGTSDDGYRVVGVADQGDEVVEATEREEFTDLVSLPYNYTLDATNYEMQLWPGTDRAGDASDVATLSLGTSHFDEVSAYVAPTAPTIASSEEVIDRLWNGTLSNTGEAPQRSTVVYAVPMTVEGVLEAQLDRGASDATAAFFDEVGPGEAHRFGLDMSAGGESLPVDRETVTLLPDAANDTYYLVYETRDVATLGVGEELELSLTFRSLSQAGTVIGGSAADTRTATLQVTEPVVTATPTATPTPTDASTATATRSPTATASATGTPRSMTSAPGSPDDDPGRTGDETAPPDGPAGTDRSTGDDATDAGTGSTEISGPGFTVATVLLALAIVSALGLRRRAD